MWRPSGREGVVFRIRTTDMVGYLGGARVDEKKASKCIDAVVRAANGTEVSRHVPAERPIQSLP